MTDISEKRELALEAKDIIESKAFNKVKADLREALVNELLTANRERWDEIIAELKVLESILGRFKAQINDYNAGVRSQMKSVPGSMRVPASG